MKHTIRLALCLVFCLVMFAPVFAGGMYDSLYSKVSNAVLHKMALRRQENEALKNKGLPGNYVIYITDEDVAAPQDTFPQHLLPLLQQNTKQSDVEKLWNFASNEYLKTAANKIQSFSLEQGFDYYVVVCAIYNYFRLDENTDFSNITWTNSNLLKSNGPVASNKTTQGDTTGGYHKLFDYLTNKFENDPRYKRGSKPTVYHFVMSTYLPDYNATDSRPVGVLRHFQALYWSIPDDAGFNNAREVFVRNRQAELAGSNNNKHKEASKEKWLLASVSATQDFIAAVKHFDESDIMAINNQVDMIQRLKRIHQQTPVLSSINFKTRAHIIKVLNTGSLEDDYSIPDLTTGGENIMLTVIKTTPAWQADSLRQLLSDNSYQLLKDLNSKFDDAGLPLTNNNYTRFVQVLTNVLASGVSSDELTDIVQKERIYKLSIGANDRHELENPFTNDIQEQFNDQLRDSVIGSFHREYSTVGVNLDDLTSYWINSHSETWSYQSLAEAYSKQAQDATYVVKPFDDDGAAIAERNLKPLDMILVIPQEDFTINGFKLEKNSFRLIPLYYYYWLRKKHDNEAWMEVAEDVGNPLLAMSMVTGLGEIIEGGNLFVQSLRGARVLFDAKMVLNSLSKGEVDNWLSEKMGKAAFEAYKKVEMLYLAYTCTHGGIILTVKAGTIMYNAVNRLYEILNRSPELLAALNARYPQLFSGFKTYFSQVLGKSLEEISGALANASSKTFKTGEAIAGKVIRDVKVGTNGKIAVIGRKMAGHVEDAAAELKVQGQNIEIFSEPYQKDNLFFIDGKNRTWQEISEDFADKSKYVRNEKGWIMDSDLPNTMMYKANKLWAEKLVKEGYTTIDIGYPEGFTSPSVFYDMELSTIFSKSLLESGISGAVAKTFKTGEAIAGKIIRDVKVGTNGKIAVIGRKMAGHVEDAAAELKVQGKNVEIFSEADQKNNLFFIDGKNRTWQEISEDFADKSKYVRNEKGWIMDSDLPNTMMYKANKLWAEKLMSEGYTIINIGYPEGFTSPSVFYDMELSTIFSK